MFIVLFRRIEEMKGFGRAEKTAHRATAHSTSASRNQGVRAIASSVAPPSSRPSLSRNLTWSRWFGQLEGLVKVYSDCEITPSSSSAPALTGGCHGWHEAGSYPVIDDDDALWNCGNLAAGGGCPGRC